VAILVAILGLIGVALVISDLGAGEGFTARVLVGVVFFLGSGILVGWLVGRRWMVSGLLAWAVLGYTLIGLIRKLSFDSPFPYWSVIVTSSTIPLVLALVGGYLGSKIRLRNRGDQ
jgi:hypothetical protein